MTDPISPTEEEVPQGIDTLSTEDRWKQVTLAALALCLQTNNLGLAAVIDHNIQALGLSEDGETLLPEWAQQQLAISAHNAEVAAKRTKRLEDRAARRIAGRPAKKVEAGVQH